MKMKIRWMLFLSIIVNLGVAQTLPEGEKQQLLQILQFDGFLSLADGNRTVAVIDAMNKASRYRVAEAIPLIKQRIWSLSGTLLDMATGVLYDLDDPNLRATAKAIVDTAERILSGGTRKNEYFFSDPKDIRQRAIYYLFKLGDFTYADRFIAYAQERGGISNVHLGISMAGMLGGAVPAYRDFAKSQLLAIMYTDTSSNGSNRKQAALSFLSSLGSDGQAGGLQQLSEFFVASEDRSGTNPTIADYISGWKYPPFEVALRTKLSSGQEQWYDGFYAKALMTNYGNPKNYSFLILYASKQDDEIIKNSILGLLATFTPGTPSAGVPIDDLLDRLVSFKHQVGQLGWLGDANFVNELDNGLENAKKHLANKDSVNAYKEVQTFQQKVNKEYEKTVDNEKKGKPRDKRFVTVEGWKFLYYNAQYIMDRLPGGKKK